MKKIQLYDITEPEFVLTLLLAIHLVIMKKAEQGNNLRVYAESRFAVISIQKALDCWNSDDMITAAYYQPEPNDKIINLL